MLRVVGKGDGSVLGGWGRIEVEWEGEFTATKLSGR